MIILHILLFIKLFKKQRERLFLLFSDMLIWARVASKDKYEFKGMLPLRSLRYRSLPDTESSFYFYLYKI